MANCKFCGKRVICSPAYHPACWEKKMNEFAEIFCDGYCRWPKECKDQDELDTHCDS